MAFAWGLVGAVRPLSILQPRPAPLPPRQDGPALRLSLLKSPGEPLASGRAIGQKIGQGNVRLVQSAREMDLVQPGDVLVTELTDPDWEPVMKRASAIVTNRGGRTCHAAIIARELGIPAVVGCGNATLTLKDGMPVTVSCAEGDTGHVYPGLLDVETVEVALDRMPACPTKIMLNVGNPELAFEFRQLPNEGVGLARLEFIINRNVGIHPKALLEFDRQPPQLHRYITRRLVAPDSPTAYSTGHPPNGHPPSRGPRRPRPLGLRISSTRGAQGEAVARAWRGLRARQHPRRRRVRTRLARGRPQDEAAGDLRRLRLRGEGPHRARHHELAPAGHPNPNTAPT